MRGLSPRGSALGRSVRGNGDDSTVARANFRAPVVRRLRNPHFQNPLRGIGSGSIVRKRRSPNCCHPAPTRHARATPSGVTVMRAASSDAHAIASRRLKSDAQKTIRARARIASGQRRTAIAWPRPFKCGVHRTSREQVAGGTLHELRMPSCSIFQRTNVRSRPQARHDFSPDS